MLKKLFILVLLLGIFGCVANDYHKDYYHVLKEYFLNLPTIKSRSAKQLAGIDLYYDSITNETFLVYVFIPSKEIRFVSLTTKKIHKRIDISELESKKGISLHLMPNYHNFDSVFFFSDKFNELNLLNGNGEIIGTFSATNDSTMATGMNYGPISLSQLPLIYHDKKIYIITPYGDIFINDSESITKYFRRPAELIIDTKNNALSRTGFFPSNYVSSFYYDFYPLRCLNNNGELVYSFKYNDSLFVYKNDILLKKVYAGSKFSSSADPMDISKVFEMSSVKKYNDEQPRYEKVIWDGFRNKYYRVFRHKQSQLNASGTIKKEKEVVWSLLIFDKQFKFIKEVVFNMHDFNYRWIVPTKEGLLISNICEGCQDLDLLKFTLIDLK